MKKKLEKVESVMCTVLSYMIGAILGVLIVVNIAQVVCRYLLPTVSLWWSEDVSILGMLWITALGAPVAWFKRTNLVMDVISNVAPKKFLDVTDYIIDFVGILSGIGLIYAGRISYIRNKGFVQSGLRFDESFRYVPIILFGIGLFIAASITFAYRFMKDPAETEIVEMEKKEEREV